MASIVKRGKRYCVVYLYTNSDNERKQKWESFPTIEEAKKRKAEVEYKREMGDFVVPQCTTVDDLLTEYIALYGKNTWALSTYQSNTRLIDNYVRPFIGGVRLTDLTTRVLEKYYQTLLQTEAVPRSAFGWKTIRTGELVTPNTVRDVHKLLRNCFAQAVKWELMYRNPCINATLPKRQQKTRDIWDAETLFHAISICDDERLRLCLNLAFACTLRIGELLGLTWDCVDVSPQSIARGDAHIQVNKELQRISKTAFKELDGKDVVMEFPAMSHRQSTVLVLKKPKTLSSVRRVFLPRSVAEMLISWKTKQEEMKTALGSEYQDYNLVIAGPFGMPVENTTINHAFRKLISENDLPPVVFHSIRHTSITYKLKLNGGDIKAVQGDSGHSQAKMVTDQYSHIIDADRKRNASLFEQQFYSGTGSTSEAKAEESNGGEEVDQDLLKKVMANPELMKLLKALAGSL